jgi:hypothetical protein
MKRHTPSTSSNAERARQSRKRAAQAKEMLENEIASLKRKVANLESIIRSAVRECTCDAKNEILQKTRRISKRALDDIENENSAASAPPLPPPFVPVPINDNNSGEPDDEQDRFEGDADDEEVPQLTEETANILRYNRARYRLSYIAFFILIYIIVSLNQVYRTK